MESDDLLTVGEVADAAGSRPRRCATTSGSAWSESSRTAGGQRRYQRSVLRRLAFIRAARNVGLSLDEVRAALDTLPRGPHADQGRLGAAVALLAVPARRADRAA